MLQAGSWIAGYRIERLLGSGGMGAVYLARHPELPRSDALKVLKEQVGADEQFRKRFLREAEVAATLDHPNIVTIYNRGRADGQLWIAMQYVSGSDCAQELAKTPAGLPVARAVEIAGAIAAGLDHAHRKGLLHRDIKPANILLSGAGERDEQRIMLTDFGVAKLADDVDTLTTAGTVLATLSYASPEQLKGQEVDGRTDQYSLAATVFHLMAGRVPFRGESTADVISAHLSAPVPRLSQVNRSVPLAVDSVIAKAMAKEPEDRFATCRQFSDALVSAMRQQPRPQATPAGAARPAAGPTPQAGVYRPAASPAPQQYAPAPASQPLLSQPGVSQPGVSQPGMSQPVPVQPAHFTAHHPSAQQSNGPSPVMIAAMIGLAVIGIAIIIAIALAA
ncbi:serine/threonine-protein kinase [Jongsikchunia kroppenstedtii]|uniref:serine/threonine-protein kinase n=1 Tax=Jongsikchunia kroppenstedtii TaxID=1121721 RepID=UPI0003750E19|nr:serine/threonine-protein kinase [Jongsikchunia kroppenstedtii]